MADATIGALRAILGIDTAAFSSGLKGAEKDLKSFSVNFGSLAKKLSIGVAVTAVVADIKKMINAADEIGKASQKFGVPVEQLSALKYAADLADVSFESLGKGLGKLNKAMLEGATNPAGEAAKNFQALGISVRDAVTGNIKPTETVFTDIAAKFATMEDGAAKTALAIRIFGRSGADLIPLLNAGRTGIKAMTDEAARLGIVISSDTAAKAEQFNDTLKKVRTSLDAIALRAAEALLPSLQKIADALASGAQQGSGLDSILKNLITEEDIQEVRSYATYWENFVRIFIAAKNIIAATVGTAAEWKAALAAADAAIQQNIKSLQLLNQSFLSLGKAGAFDSLDNLPQQLDQIGKKFSGVNTAALATKDALAQFLDGINKSTAAAKAEAETIGLGAGAHAFLKTTLEALAIAKAKDITLSQQQRDAIIATANEAALAAERLGAVKNIQEALPEWQKLQDKITEIQAQMAMFPDLAEGLKGALLKAQNDVFVMAAGAAAAVLGGISQVFTAFGQHNKKLFEIGKAFAIAEATVNTYKAAAQAFTAPPGPPFSYAYMAAAIAAGLANVIKISQTKYTGAALGGSFKVPGGISGFDSKLVPMMLSPGERVDVTPASKVGQGGSRELVIPSIKPKDFFTGEVVREMVMSIDRWMKDGGTGIRIGAT